MRPPVDLPGGQIIHGDNLKILPKLPDAFARMIYIDPPFNTGKRQKRNRGGAASLGLVAPGFGRCQIEYEDRFEDYLAFLIPRVKASLHCLTADGSLFVHLDYREVHYVKVALDQLLGRKRFKNEIIWAYDFGGRSKTRWPTKHDTILWYVMDPAHYVFNYEAMDRIPYLSRGLIPRGKRRRGKTPTDVWWHATVPINGREKTGYPTQKPLGILNRLVNIHTEPSDVVLDFFGGSGTTGEAAALFDRRFVLIDKSADAINIMSHRLRQFRSRCTRSLPKSMF